MAPRAPLPKTPAAEGEAPLTFEESLAALQEIVGELEDGAMGLEASLTQFERGIRLLRSCYAILEAAETRVEILTRTPAGDLCEAPFDATATFEQPRGDANGAGNAREKPSLFE